MKLYLVRHGTALTNAFDTEPGLSDIGQKEVLQSAEYLVQHSDQAVDVFHSGLLRAQQTAEIIAEKIAAHSIARLAGLRPNDKTADVLLDIASWQSDTLLVGHLPFMHLLLSELIGQPGMAINFSPATVICITRVGNRWQLEWQFSPKAKI